MVKALRYSKACAGSKDRRQSVRYSITGTASFQWKAADGSWYEASGLTRNIGKAGVFVECESLPPVACLLKLIVTLPTDWRAHMTLRLRGAGDVRHIRTEASKIRGYGAFIAFHMKLPIVPTDPQEGE